MGIESLHGGKIELLDGRSQHNNGWFVVRSTLSKGTIRNAVEWLVTPHPLPHFLHQPVVQVSQVGYHPKQQKIAVIELDARDTSAHPVKLIRVGENGNQETIIEKPARDWGKFLRYRALSTRFHPHPKGRHVQRKLRR